MLGIVISVVLLAQAPEGKTPEQPAFYDNPQFVVSGVADYTYRGGHGSDAVLRSSEALTKNVVTLGSPSAVDSTPLSEKVLKDELANHPNNSALHHKLAEVEERLGKPVDAVHEYQRAEELLPSEANLFDWGAELLKHRAGEPAIEVFENGRRQFPRSTRMRLGLAVAFYLQGKYEEAKQEFFAATDLDPHDSLPYSFLGQVQAKEITESDGYLERVQRFASLEPNNAWANYYYAACLWQRRSRGPVRALAQRATQLDPKMDVAYLLLGTIDAEQKNLTAAIEMFSKAVQINPELAEAYYRLAQAYEATGDKTQAQQERAIYKKLSDESAERTERERKQVQQFVFASKH
jgi:tetratricopeptide (TPR) repeat protein